MAGHVIRYSAYVACVGEKLWDNERTLRNVIETQKVQISELRVQVVELKQDKQDMMNSGLDDMIGEFDRDQVSDNEACWCISHAQLFRYYDFS